MTSQQSLPCCSFTHSTLPPPSSHCLKAALNGIPTANPAAMRPKSVAVLGLNPWITPYQLWLTKTGRFEPPVTQAMQRGTDLEPVARAAYEEETGLVMQPLVLEAGAYSASLEGMTLEVAN